MKPALLYLIGFCLGFFGCRHNIPPQPGTLSGDVVERPGYHYIWASPSEADVLVFQPYELRKAIDELCPGKPCAIEEVGTVYRVIGLQ